MFLEVEDVRLSRNDAARVKEVNGSSLAQDFGCTNNSVANCLAFPEHTKSTKTPPHLCSNYSFSLRLSFLYPQLIKSYIPFKFHSNFSL